MPLDTFIIAMQAPLSRIEVAGPEISGAVEVDIQKLAGVPQNVLGSGVFVFALSKLECVAHGERKQIHFPPGWGRHIWQHAGPVVGAGWAGWEEGDGAGGGGWAVGGAGFAAPLGVCWVV